MENKKIQEFTNKIYEAVLINEGVKDLQNGRVINGDEVKKRIEKKYGVK